MHAITLKNTYSEESTMLRNAMTIVNRNTRSSLLSKIRNLQNNKTMLVPKELLNIPYGIDYYSLLDFDTTFSSSPHVKFSDITNIAEKLSMMIIPESYMTFDLTGESWNTTRAVQRARDRADKNGLRVWVLTPINNYSVEKHVNDTIDYEFFAPLSIAPTITACKLIIPTLRGMKNQLDALSTKVDNIAQQQDNLSQTVKQQAKQIELLSQQVERNRVLALKEAAKTKELEAEVKRRSEASLFSQIDPMIILLPKDVTNIYDYTGNAILGPVWGPDMDDIMLELSNVQVMNQKTKEQHNTNLKYNG